MDYFADRIVAAVRLKKTPTLVGLDPRAEWLPHELFERHGLGGSAAQRVWARAIEEFCSRVLDVVAPWVPAVKLQSAFFERHGAPGVAALWTVLGKAQRLGLIAILDAKRADIGSTSEAYAEAAFGAVDVTRLGDGGGGRFQADALTVSPYLGMDSLEPFLKFARDGRNGVFVLVRTSNAGASDLQQLSAGPAGRPIWRQVAEWVREWSEATVGSSGYGAVGAVVGGTARDEMAEFRAAMPQAVLLVPGYGAQGATASDIAAAFDPHGLGVLVNSSRAILFPNVAARGGADRSSGPWEDEIERALRRTIDDLATHTPAGRLRV